MEDLRVPGTSEPASLTFACPVTGCQEQEVDDSPPDCPAHAVTMVALETHLSLRASGMLGSGASTNAPAAT